MANQYVIAPKNTLKTCKNKNKNIKKNILELDDHIAKNIIALCKLMQKKK